MRKIMAGVFLTVSVALTACGSVDHPGSVSGEPTGKEAGAEQEVAENTVQKPETKENSGKKYRYVMQKGPYGSIRIGLLNGWSAKTCAVDDESLRSADYGICFFRNGEKKKFIEVGYNTSFGVCGTGLTVKDTTLAGSIAEMGYYDGSEIWDYVTFGGEYDNKIIALNCASGKKWWKKYSNQVMEMLDSLEFHPDEQEGAIGEYDRMSEWDSRSLQVSAVKISPEKATLKFMQYDSEEKAELSFGEDFHIERKEGDEWKEVPYADGKEFAYQDLAHSIKIDDTTEYAYAWKWLYGSLKPGKYRISAHVLAFEEGEKVEEKTIYAVFILR